MKDKTTGNPISHDEGSGVHDKETSNVDLAEETIHMILAQEGFEINLRWLEA